MCMFSSLRQSQVTYTCRHVASASSQLKDAPPPPPVGGPELTYLPHATHHMSQPSPPPLHLSSTPPPPLHPSSTSCPVRCSGRGGESCLCWTWHGTTPDGQETLVRTDGAVGVVTSCVTATSLNLPLNTFRWRTLKSCRYAEQRETAEFYVTDAEKDAWE